MSLNKVIVVIVFIVSFIISFCLVYHLDPQEVNHLFHCQIKLENDLITEFPGWQQRWYVFECSQITKLPSDMQGGGGERPGKGGGFAQVRHCVGGIHRRVCYSTGHPVTWVYHHNTRTRTHHTQTLPQHCHVQLLQSVYIILLTFF